MPQPVSQAWRDLLTKDRELVARVDLVDRHGAIRHSTRTGTPEPLQITGLQVTEDRTRMIRGDATATVTVATGHPLIPRTPTDLLSPISGTTFRVSAGFRIPGQPEPELVACGRFDLEEVAVTETAAGVEIVLSGVDLTGRLDAATLTEPYSIVWGTRHVDTARTLIESVIPDLEFHIMPSAHTSAWVVLDEGTNRLTELHEIVASIGFEMYVDPTGEYMVIAPTPTTSDNAAWSYTADQFGQVTRLVNTMSRSRVNNGVLGKGENVNSDDPPVQRLVWDTEPGSPTYYDPANPHLTWIGPRPLTFTSQWIRTQQQCDDAVTAKLREVKGLMQRVTVNATMNPAVNAGDVIHLDRPGSGAVGRYLVERTSFDLGNPDTMELVCQERRV